MANHCAPWPVKTNPMEDFPSGLVPSPSVLAKALLNSETVDAETASLHSSDDLRWHRVNANRSIISSSPMSLFRSMYDAICVLSRILINFNSQESCNVPISSICVLSAALSFALKMKRRLLRVSIKPGTSSTFLASAVLKDEELHISRLEEPFT